MDEHRKREIWFKIARFIGKPFVCLKYRYKYDSFKDVKGPLLVLANHTTDLDSLFIAIAAGKQLYFVATENITRMPRFGKLIMKIFAPIIHYKGMPGIRTSKIMLRHLKAGHSVAVFPEGNRTFNGVTLPMGDANGKLAIASGATLVTYRIKGGYFTSPRWHKKDRRGRVRGELAGVYTHEELKAMGPDEVNRIIARDLYLDAYEEQKKDPWAYTGPDIAENLESTVFLCPKCGKIGGLHSQGNRFFCDCGFDAIFDEYGYIKDKDQHQWTVTELDIKQREYIDDLQKNSGEEELFEDEVSEETVDENHDVVSERRVVLKAFANAFGVDDKNVSFDDIEAIAINQKNLLMFHLKGMKSHYQFRGPLSFSALKYLYVFRAAKGSWNGIL